MNIELKNIGHVINSRQSPIDDDWGNILSEIELADHIPTEAFNGIESFSHLEIIYFLDKVKKNNIVLSGHPRENPAYPLVGIFAQRKRNRPNQIGLCTVELLKHEGRKITVKYLDALDGTPVLDIKPVFKEFEPKGNIKQPEWATDLMKKYW
jgi:tRNA-Thr(GGU) m(6)t(6)A37 methyltransferase TsaA